MSETVINVRQEAQRFVNALHALCPSRNYFSQYLLMIPKEYPTIYDLFPEFLSDEEIRNDLKNAFGLEYAYQVNVIGDKLAYHFRNFLVRFLDIMESGDVRNSLCRLLGVSNEALLNPRLEWIKSRLEGIKSERSIGPIVVEILKILLMTDEPYPQWRSTEDLRKKLGKTADEVERGLKLAEDIWLVVSEQKGGRAGYSLSPDLKKYIVIVKETIGS